MEDSSSHHRRNCVVNPNANANLLLQATSFGYPEMAAVLAAQQLASSHVQHTMVNSGQQQDEDDPLPSSSRGGGRTRSGDSKSSSAYASRHQQAEARRRNRINERWAGLFRGLHRVLDRLRGTGGDPAMACAAGNAWHACEAAHAPHVRCCCCCTLERECLAMMPAHDA
jgi:hypothetical protein